MKPMPYSHVGARRRWLVGFAVLAVTALLTCLVRLPSARNSTEEKEARYVESNATPTSLQDPASMASTNLSAPGASALAAAPMARPKVLDEATMLSALTEWIKRKEGKELRVVDSRKVLDSTGKPVSLAVIVSSLPGGLSSEELKAGLQHNAHRETDLRKQLQEAYRKQDITTVDQIVSELAAGRARFIETNKVASYRLSLEEVQPPILARWDGLTFESVREPEALALVQAQLGPTTRLANLVAYTSMASLLRFTNAAGVSMAVDPVTLRIVVLPEMASVPNHLSESQADRANRIVRQWNDFLNR